MTAKSWSLSRRLILSAVIWISLSLSLSGIVLSFIFEQTVRGAFDENLTAQLRAVTAGLEVDDAGQLTVADPLDDAHYHQVLSGWYWQIASPDGVVARSRSLWDVELSAPRDIAPGAVSFHDLPGPRDQALRAAATLVNRAGSPGLSVMAALDTTPMHAQVTRFNRIIFAALGTLGVGLALAVVLQVVYGLRPLARLTAELKAIGEGDQDKLSADHPREVAPLAAAFNDIRAQDQERLAKTRRDVGNLAHALKTPLAQLATDLGALPDDVRRKAIAHINELKGKIDIHAARAATAASRALTARRIDVRAVVDDIVAALAKIHVEAPKAVTIDILPGARVLADEEDVTEIAGNLLDNAFKWARREIAVSVRDGAGAVVITVDDDGPGVPQDQLAGILRGVRLDESVPGTGLGLQVVKDIAEAYGGGLVLASSRLGGLSAAVHLPIRTAATTSPT